MKPESVTRVIEDLEPILTDQDLEDLDTVNAWLNQGN